MSTEMNVDLRTPFGILCSIGKWTYRGIKYANAKAKENERIRQEEEIKKEQIRKEKFLLAKIGIVTVDDANRIYIAGQISFSRCEEIIKILTSNV